MDCFLVVKVVDVMDEPVDGATVSAFFEGAGDKTLDPTSNPGVFECPVPAGSPSCTITVLAAGFWDATQTIEIRSTSPPTARFATRQELNTTVLAVASRAQDFNLEVHFVLGHLRDMTQKVLQTGAMLGVPLSTAPTSIRRIGTPILNPAGSGISLVNFEEATVELRGELLFAERMSAPNVVAIYHPGWNNPRNDQQATVPNSYHVFFHPAPLWPEQPPLTWGLLNFMARYLVLPWDLGKAFAHQNVADTLKNIFVLPVGSEPADSSWQGDLTTQAALYRYLGEINFFVQRKRGVSIPRQPVGRSALSCFSAGADWLDAILRGPKLPRFFDELLRNIFVLDGVVASNKSPAATVAICNALVRWFRRGQQGRSLRVYTQSALWFDTLDAQIPGTDRFSGAAGARERESPACTLLHTPRSFWKPVVGEDRFGPVHQLMSAWFMEHAVTHSAFSA